MNVSNDDQKDFKQYFSDNNECRLANHYFLKKHLFRGEFSSPIKEKLNKGGKVLDLG
jgi:hypothetical protein